ncbi:MAG: hypothetical protein ABIH26_04405, partial [Candidatus Eisenbacteria bacterium]
MKKHLVLVSLLALSCARGAERIATRGEPAGDLYVHSPGAPRVNLEETERSGRAPDPPAGSVLWQARLPLGPTEGRRPAILLAAGPSGDPLEGRIRIDPLGLGDFLSADPVPLEPDEESEGYYWTPAIPFSFPAVLPSGTVEASASFRLLLRVGAEGGWVRLYPDEIRTGVFPGDGKRFLLYDGDRNGIHDLADRLVIDANGDGTFDGNRNSIELYAMDEPFL